MKNLNIFKIQPKPHILIKMILEASLKSTKLIQITKTFRNRSHKVFQL